MWLDRRPVFMASRVRASGSDCRAQERKEMMGSLSAVRQSLQVLTAARQPPRFCGALSTSDEPLRQPKTPAPKKGVSDETACCDPDLLGCRLETTGDSAQFSWRSPPDWRRRRCPRRR